LNDWLEVLVDWLIPVRTHLVFITSVFTVVLSLLFSFYFRFEFSFPPGEVIWLPRVMLLAVLVKLAVFFVFRLYGGMWRYVSIIDLVRILVANTVASGVLVAVVYFGRERFFPGFAISVLVIDYLICFLMMSGKRVAVRIIRESAARAGSGEERVIVIGDSARANSLIQALSASQSGRRIIGVLCEDVKVGHTIRGAPVLGLPSRLAKCAGKHRATEALLLPPYSAPANIKKIMEDLEERQIKCVLRMIPSYEDIAGGNISVSYIKEVEIEDLLGRKPVRLDRTDVAAFVKGKSILVTGAGGSIGSELCRQLAAYMPAKMVLMDFSELNLYTVEKDLRGSGCDFKLRTVIGDVRIPADIERAFADGNIDIVYHAAAYKHVPLMEDNPLAAFRTNVLGTANVAAFCEKFGAARMVMISTDKAVNPSSVMGATKRLAERILLERGDSKTEFVAVRFGNVLGSSGSVIPLFKEQIKKGGPVTVTTERMVRYFMSIPEAVDLVLQAGAVGRDRDIMLLEMGEPVRIYDMAKKLIELSGFIPGKDIAVEFTGLRKGEKEYEELLTDQEKADKTPFDRIFAARKSGAGAAPRPDLEKIRALVEAGDGKSLLAVIAECIPENKFSEAKRDNPSSTETREIKSRRAGAVGF
jgi:FlaA1/EpsC-like NDP-sugar epimerase